VASEVRTAPVSKARPLVPKGIEVVHPSGSSPWRSQMALRLLELSGWVVRGFNEYRLSSRFGRVFGGLFNISESMRISFDEDVSFVFPANDSYWNRLAMRGYRYEPELETVFRDIATADFVFLDCGANFGFWSVLVSSPLFGSKPTFAVEPSAETFRHLIRNRSENNARYTAIQKAIYSRSGESLQFGGDSHSGRSIRDGATTTPGPLETVDTLALDDLLKMSAGASDLPIVMKLDIEGAERAALEASREIFHREVLIIYEDHGKDTHDDVTAFVLDRLKWSVVFLAKENRISIPNLATLRPLKRRRVVGYNLMAYRPGGFWHKLFGGERSCHG
jgi:FkbM family methyltransferase